MTEHWNPGEFKDTYHDDLMARIKEKIKLGQTREITPPSKEEEGQPRSAQVIDLAALLKESLGKGGAARKPATRQAAPARGKPSLHVVAGSRSIATPAAKTASKPAAKTAAKTAARRKRA